MSGVAALEKLRERLRVCGCDPDECMTCSVPLEVKAGLANVEAEIVERFIELPVDADGVPICIGDELCLSELTHGKVSALMLTPNGWEWELEGDGWYDVGFTYHVEPDPVDERFEMLGNGKLTAEQMRDDSAKKLEEDVIGRATLSYYGDGTIRLDSSYMDRASLADVFDWLDRRSLITKSELSAERWETPTARQIDPYDAVSCEHVISPDILHLILDEWDVHPG